MNKNQKQTAVHLKPKNGQNETTQIFDLNGYVESMVVYTRGNEAELQPLETTQPLIFMSLQDNNNGDIIPMVHIDNYKQQGGGYKESLKPLGFEANNQTFALTLKTERTSNDSVANDIEVFVYFFYGDKPKAVAVKPISPVRQSVARPKGNAVASIRPVRTTFIR